MSETLEIQKITSDDITRAVLDLAKEFPKEIYVYDDCLYTEGPAGDDEGCLFGQALMRAGVPLSVLKEYDKSGFECSNIQNLIGWLNGNYGTEINYQQEWLEIQLRQDQKMPWGEAISPLVKN